MRDTHKLRLAEIDHEHLRCTIGQWIPKENKFSLFPGSTVPYISTIEEALQKNGNGANQLMTGLFKPYKKDKHKKKYDAFRIESKLPIRRTADDLDYDRDDRIEVMPPYDSIHAAYCKGLNHPYFGSAGCQVIMGYPKIEGSKKYLEHTGPWKQFLDNAYKGRKQQSNFYYGLFDGKEVEEICRFRVDKHVEARLRYGSNDKTYSCHGEGEE